MPEHILTIDELATLAETLRTAEGDTQQALAEAIGADQAEVSRALRGENEAVLCDIVQHYEGQPVRRRYVVG